MCSSSFIVPNKDGGLHPILDLCNLNHGEWFWMDVQFRVFGKVIIFHGT